MNLGITKEIIIEIITRIVITPTPVATENVVAHVTGQYGAGRCQKGDFSWTFDNAAEDDNVAVEGDPYGVIRDKYLESQGSKRPVTIHFEGGAWFDKEGNEFADQNDGTFIEVKTGDVFDFIHDVVE